MGNPRAKRIVLCSLLLVILISSVTALSGHAENYPDIGNISQTLYLSGNQQFFHRPGDGYVLISTDFSSKTMVSLLDSNGNLDYSCGRKAISLKFAYQKAALYGNFLYLAGWAPDISGCVAIERIDLTAGKYLLNKIIKVDCDFTKNFSVDENGISLLTVPAGNPIDASTIASLYIFDSEHDGTCIEAQARAPVSSVPSASSGTDSIVSTASSVTSGIGSESSSAASTASGIVSAPSSAAPSQQPDETKPSTFHFHGPVTVASLQKELDANALGQQLRVLTADHKEVKDGSIGTGSIVETILNGKTESRYTAVIPGDLDGTGTVTEYDCQILYNYFTKTSALRPSVLSGPYFEAALLSNTNTIDSSRSELHPGDILKIKKLIK
ncbi:MAG: hypothetical protein K0Q85_1368 [Caproiciproducens sp.]|nr:hypothetical protein [Caproiciproducens sp.]